MERLTAALLADPARAAVACKMLSLDDPRVYDAGDILRRDGACEQRGRFGRDDGRWDAAGEVFGACAGAALYRRASVLGWVGFDETLLRLPGGCRSGSAPAARGLALPLRPAVALHAGEGSSRGCEAATICSSPATRSCSWRSAFPVRWLPYVAYRQLGWAWHAARERRLGAHLRAIGRGGADAPGCVARASRFPPRPRVPIEVAVPPRPFRGPRAGGHPAQIARAERSRYARAVLDRQTSRARSGRGRQRAQCAWCGAPARPSSAPPGRLPGHAAPPRPTRRRTTPSSSGRTPTGTGRVGPLLRRRRRRARALPRGARPPAGSDRSSGPDARRRRRGRGARSRRFERRGREAVGLEREASGEGILAGEIEDFDDRAVSGRPSCSGTRSSTSVIPAARSTARRRCSRPAACSRSPCPISAAGRRAASASSGFTSTCRHFVHLPAARSRRPRGAGTAASSAAATGAADNSCLAGCTGWCAHSPATSTCTARSGGPRRGIPRSAGAAADAALLAGACARAGRRRRSWR